MRSDLVDITLILVHQTDKAYGCMESEGEEVVWLPKSLVEREPTKKANVFVFTMPEYLAHEKELI